MLLFAMSCGDGKVTKCSQLDGTYWRTTPNAQTFETEEFNDKVGLIKFEDDSIYSGQTGKAMSYTYTEKAGKVGEVASFKLDDNSRLTISIFSHHIPFEQITKEEYNNLLEQNKKARKNKKKSKK